MLLIAQAWGVDVAGVARRATPAADGRSRPWAGSSLILVVVQWSWRKLIQTGAARYIAATDANGNLLYSNRTRTLVSMARNLMP